MRCRAAAGVPHADGTAHRLQEVRQFLATDALESEVKYEAWRWKESVSGVPYFVITMPGSRGRPMGFSGAALHASVLAAECVWALQGHSPRRRSSTYSRGFCRSCGGARARGDQR